MNLKCAKTGYIYTSQNQKKELDAICFGDSQCIWIESSVGLGGWRLAQTFCAQLGANINAVFFDLDIGTEIANAKKWVYGQWLKSYWIKR